MQEITIYDIDNIPIVNLVQWDKDVKIFIKEDGIDDSYKVHFFNCNSSDAMVVESTYNDGVLSTVVPNDILTEPHSITGYIYVEKNNECKSVYLFRIVVRKRPKPANYVYSDQKEYVTFEKILKEAKKFADEAEIYSKMAKSYTRGGTGLRDDEDLDNAQKYYEQSKINAQAAETSEINSKESEKSALESKKEAIQAAKEAANSAQAAGISETNTKESEIASKLSETNSKASEDKSLEYANTAKEYKDIAVQKAADASASEIAAANSEQVATEKAADSSASAVNAANNADLAEKKADEASASAESADNFQKLAESFARGGTGVRVGEDTDNSMFYLQLSQQLTDEAQKLLEQAQKIIAAAVAGTLLPMGTVAFEDLPITPDTGHMYNISDDFTTDSRFVEGAGIFYRAGANIYWTKDGKWDVLVGTQVTGVKGDAESVYHVGNVNITKANIGLGNVDNTADIDKPVSKVQQNALDGKVSKSGDILTGAMTSYGTAEEGVHGTYGYVRFANIHINAVYENRTIQFIIGGRGRKEITRVSVLFESVANVDPALDSFTKEGDCSYPIYISKIGTSSWDLYAQKNESYGLVNVFDTYVADNDVGNITITYPNELMESVGSNWIAASIGGQVYRSNVVADSEISGDITLSWDGSVSQKEWVAVWNDGQEIRAMRAGNMIPEITEQSTRSNLVPKERLSVMLGKIKKYFTDLKTVAFSGKYIDLTGTPTSLPANGGTAETISTTLPISKGGTGKTTGGDAVNALINSLDVGTGDPTDDTYFLSQNNNGSDTYFRRPVSKIWNYIKSKLATVAISGSYNDLSNRPSIPSVGNGTVTVKQNGTVKGTFTMNQSGGATIELNDTWKANGKNQDGYVIAPGNKQPNLVWGTDDAGNPGWMIHSLEHKYISGKESNSNWFFIRVSATSYIGYYIRNLGTLAFTSNKANNVIVASISGVGDTAAISAAFQDIFSGKVVSVDPIGITVFSNGYSNSQIYNTNTGGLSFRIWSNYSATMTSVVVNATCLIHTISIVNEI